MGGLIDTMLLMKHSLGGYGSDYYDYLIISIIAIIAMKAKFAVPINLL